MGSVDKLNLIWRDNQSPAINQESLNNLTQKINELVDIINNNQSNIDSIPKTTSNLINDSGFVTQSTLGRSSSYIYSGSENEIHKDVDVGFYPSFVEVVETTNSGRVISTHSFTYDFSIPGEYSVLFVPSGVRINCTSGKLLNKPNHTYHVNCRFVWDFYASAKPITKNIINDVNNPKDSVSISLKDNYIYYIEGYKNILCTMPPDVPHYSCYLYITLPNDEDYVPNIQLPIYTFGDSLDMISKGSSLEISVDNKGGALVLNKGVV